MNGACWSRPPGLRSSVLGTFVLLASHDDHATLEYPTLQLDHGRGRADLALELGPGGAIEGHVRTAGGHPVAGAIVGISRGDGRGRTQRVGADGLFRFEHLTPGPWRVMEREEEVVPNSTTSTDSVLPPPPIQWDCEVRAGRTTVFDLGIEAAAPFRGRLLLGRQRHLKG